MKQCLIMTATPALISKFAIRSGMAFAVRCGLVGIQPITNGRTIA